MDGEYEMSEKSNYEKLAAIDVSKHIEKKNGLSYLSWAWAVDTLLKADPTADWSYGEPVKFGETLMVSCTVKAFGKPMTMHLPVMDYRNKAIPNPDAFAVNTAMMRCLVKCIALHGLGLYIYAGEDLPEESKKGQSTPKDVWDSLTSEKQQELQGVADTVRELLGSDLALAVGHIADLETEDKIAVWSRLDSKERRTIKDYQEANKK